MTTKLYPYQSTILMICRAVIAARQSVEVVMDIGTGVSQITAILAASDDVMLIADPDVGNYARRLGAKHVTTPIKAGRELYAANVYVVDLPKYPKTHPLLFSEGASVIWFSHLRRRHPGLVCIYGPTIMELQKLEPPSPSPF